MDVVRAHEASSSVGSAPLVVLVVEDEPLIAMTTVDMIEGMGHVALEAGSAAAALALLVARPDVDLIISDIGLPDMGGEALCERARAMRADLPVVYATGIPRAELAQPDASPPTIVLVKPYSRDELARAVGAAMAAAVPVA